MQDPRLLNKPPDRPRAVLRVGFAGRKDLLPPEEKNLRSALDLIFSTMGRKLAGLTKGIPVDAGSEPKVAEFFHTDCPLLRLITGLCEGADDVAAQELKKITVHPDPSPNSEVATPTVCLETELAAVIPFDLVTYRSSRPLAFLPTFDLQAQSCEYILALDGIYDKTPPLGDIRRGRGYRAQSATLLRHSDILVAATDPTNPAKAGGTLESVRAAIAFGLPVVFIHTGTGDMRLIVPTDDIDSVLVLPAAPVDKFTSNLKNLVSKIVASPDIGNVAAAERESAEQGLHMLHEYFEAKATPRNIRTYWGEVVVHHTLREQLWTAMESIFAYGRKPKSDAVIKGYKPYRGRATSLNYHYSGLYRGAFLLNYSLSVVAVLLATLSLVLLTMVHTEVPTWIFWTQLLLGIMELGILFTITFNTHRAKHNKWNDLAVDYRYLAERLRAMFYLPTAGSFQPRAPSPPQYGPRAIHQSAVDWLFNAIARSVSPAELAKETTISIPGGPPPYTVKLILPDPLKTIQTVRDRWVAEQVIYHARNARTNERIYNFTVKWGTLLSILVILIGLIDLAGVALCLSKMLPEEFKSIVHRSAPWLILLTAVFPAAVAALNGFRFQSECRRLAERSAVMHSLLGGVPDPRHGLCADPDGGLWKEADDLAAKIASAHSAPTTNVGAWSLDCLRLTERIAEQTLRETAEWTVLYTKEIAEP